MPQIMPPKDPDATLDYTWDWATWLGTDTIATSVVTVIDSGLTLTTQANTTTQVTAWFSGGTAGQSYAVRNRITTAAGRTNDATIIIRIQDN